MSLLPNSFAPSVSPWQQESDALADRGAVQVMIQVIVSVLLIGGYLAGMAVVAIRENNRADRRAWHRHLEELERWYDRTYGSDWTK
jgi:hypothetical protein